MKPAIQFCRCKVICNRKNVINYVILIEVTRKVWVSECSVQEWAEQETQKCLNAPRICSAVSAYEKSIKRGVWSQAKE